MLMCVTHPDVSLELTKGGGYCPACARCVSPDDAPATLDASPPAMPNRRLPSVLALPWAAFLHEPVPTLALWAACDLIEMTLRLCVTAGIAQHVTLPPKLREALRRNVERPTMGQWLAMAKAVVDEEAADEHLPLKTLVKSVAELLGTSTAAPDRALLAMRNRLAHGGPLPRAEARALLHRWAPRVREWATSALAPLEATDLVAVDAQGGWLLLAGDEACPASRSVPVPRDAAPGSAWLCVAGRALPLGPLAAFDAGVHMYVRRGEMRLQYVRVSDQGGLTESTAEAVEQFDRMFLDDEDLDARGRARRVQGFEREFAREAGRRVGRDDELRRLSEVVRSARGGVVWVSGTAGMGKSNLMASLAVSADAREDTLVLPYRFRATDARCSRETFLRYVEERIDDRWLSASGKASSKRPADATASLQAVLGLLDRLRPDVQVLWILDGIDEIDERDPTFVSDVLLRLRHPACTIVVAARPSHGLDDAFRKVDAAVPFVDGLPPMSEHDVRKLILEMTADRRRQVVEQDRETSSGVANAFIEQVTLRSEGVPIYVNHVVGDLLAGRLRADRPEALPARLVDYHEKLLVQAAAGDLQGITTHVVAMLAVAHDSLTAAELSALLLRRTLLAEPDAEIAEGALLALATMLRRARRPDGAHAYALFHRSLCTHILENDRMRHAVGTARTTLAAFAERPEEDAATGYLHRCGVRHLVDVARTERAIARLKDLRVTMARLMHLEEADAVAGWVEDWRRVQVASGTLEGEAEAWCAFAQASEHALVKAGRFAHRVLFQLAMEHADTSPVTVAAEAYEVSVSPEWPWLRPLNRPRPASLEPLIRDVEALGGGVLGAISLEDGTFLTWHDDGSVRTWSTARATCLATRVWHDGPVAGVSRAPDGRFLSWTSDGSVREGTLSDADLSVTLPLTPYVWDEVVRVGAAHLVARAHTRGSTDVVQLWNLRTREHERMTDPRVPRRARGILPLGDGSVLCWGIGPVCRWWPAEDRPAVIWSDTVDYVHAVVATPELVTLFRPGGRLETFRLDDGACVYRGELGAEPARGSAPIAPGRHAVWCKDGSVRTWVPEGGLQVTLPCATNVPRGVARLDDTRVVSWERSHTLRVWRSDTGEELGRWRAPGQTKGCLHLRDGAMLSWSHDGRFFTWDAARVDDLGEDEHHENAIQHVLVLRDGRVVTCAPDRTVRIWSEDGAHLRTYRGHARSVVGALQLSDGRVVSWEVTQGARDVPGACTLQAWCPDTAAQGRTLQGGSERAGHLAAVRGATEIPDGRLLSWGSDGSVCTWNLNDGHLLEVVRLGISHLTCAVRLPDGTLVTGTRRGDLHAWSADGTPLHAHRGTDGEVKGVIDAGDGSVLAWSDAAVQRWRPHEGRLTTTYRAATGREWRGAACLDAARFVLWSEADGRTPAGSTAEGEGIRSERLVTLYSLITGECLARHPRYEGIPACARDGALVALHAWLVASPDTRLTGLPWRNERAYLTTGRRLRAFRVSDGPAPA